jgi:hypothetical protein
MARAAKPATSPKPPTLPRLSFRAFLESNAFCGLAPSPAVGAIVDASEGREVELDDVACRAIFRCGRIGLPREARRLIVVGAGGRGGKTSRLLAPKAVHAAWTVPLPTLADGEVAVSLLVAPKRRLAMQGFAMVKGIINRSPILRAAVVEETKGAMLSITLQRPDGTRVRVEVGSANRGGQDARAYTLVFCGLDEAAFFYADDGYTVTDAEIFDAAFQRIVPGGQLWIVSTPWIEGVGIMEQYIESDWGTHINALVAARIGTRVLNPTWDEAGEIERAIRARPGGDEIADREILALPLAKGSSSFFDPAAIKAACERMPPEGKAVGAGAGADFGHTSDASALGIVDRYLDNLFAPSVASEIPSTSGQTPSATYNAFADSLIARGVKSFAADGHYKEAVREAFAKRGIQYVEAPEGNDGKTITYLHARDALVEGRLCLGALPPGDRARLASQLRGVISKPMEQGRIKLSFPRRRLADVLKGTASGGHGDSVSALVLAMWRAGAGKPATTTESRRLIRGGATRGSLSRRVWTRDPRTGGAPKPEAPAEPEAQT